MSFARCFAVVSFSDINRKKEGAVSRKSNTGCELKTSECDPIGELKSTSWSFRDWFFSWETLGISIVAASVSLVINILIRQ